MNTTPPLPTPQQIIDTIAALSPYISPLQIYYTPFATHDETVTRTWKERLFTRPWQPWQRYKLHSHPAIYIAKIPFHFLPTLPHLPQRKATYIIAHPSFENAIETALSAPANRNDEHQLRKVDSQEGDQSK